MKITGQRKVEKAVIEQGEFNNCEHLFVEMAQGEHQTISCKLPNGVFVTFAFVPNSDGSFECVDLHTTVQKTTLMKFGVKVEQPTAYVQQLIGFNRGSNSFDTRRMKSKTLLATLLLHKSHYPEGGDTK